MLTTSHGRQLVQTVFIELIITIRSNLQTPETIQQATKVLIEAIGGPAAAALPPNATLSDLVATLNSLVSDSTAPDSTAQQLLGTVNDAIASAGLTAVFNNATLAPTGGQLQL
jgi:hypothetical protein